MKKLLFLLSLSLVFACNTATKENSTSEKTAKTAPDTTQTENFGIVIHGGAGTILKENMSDSMETAYKQKLEEAIRTGYNILKNGGTSLEAVQRTINVMENSPLFNSGKGAVFAHDGTNQMDASIMDGKTLMQGPLPE